MNLQVDPMVKEMENKKSTELKIGTKDKLQEAVDKCKREINMDEGISKDMAEAMKNINEYYAHYYIYRFCWT